MKKSFKLLFAALFALAAVVPAQAAEITVFDGTATCEEVPVRSYYYDTDDYPVQTILPAAELTAMQGADITAMKFYIATEGGNQMSGGKLAVSIGTTEMNSFYQSLITTGLTKVAEITMTVGETEMVVNFDEPWTYEGGNIVIETRVVETGNCPHVFFYGQNASVANAAYGKSYVSTTGFYPKTTFTFNPVGDKATVSTNAINFGKLYPEQEAEPQTFTIKNVGVNAFTPVFSGVAAPYSVTPAPAEIAAGESVTYTVTFAPTELGEYDQTLAINCGAAGQFEIALTGAMVEVPAEVVVAEGEATHKAVPVYTDAYDYSAGNNQAQMIYNADMLTELVGKKINAIKFHASAPFQKLNGGNIQLSVKVVEQSVFESETAITDLNVVATGAPVLGESEIVFNFNEPFEYTGGNLAIETLVLEAGEYSFNDYFLGVNTTDYVSYAHFNDLGWETHTYKFLPMATFGYVKEEGGQEDGITLLSEANALEDAAEFTFDGDAVVTAFKNGYLFLRDESGYGMISGVEGAFENGQVLNQGWNATKTSNNGWVSYSNAAGLSASGETNAELAAAQKLTAFPEESMLNAYVYVEKVNKGFFPLRSLTLPDGNTITIASYPWAVNQPASSGDWNAYGVIVKNNGVLEFALVEWEKYVEPEPEYLRGDVNRDKVVNIADVTALIDMLLNGDAMIPEADCNLDNAMNIADVTALIDYLLSGQW